MLNKKEYFSINIKKSEEARNTICRGLVLAENPFRLLMAAIKCIADMSGDTGFYDICLKAMDNVYGAGLNEHEYAMYRAEELEQSIKQLQEGISQCREQSTRERLAFAVRMQTEELKRLKKG